LEHEAQPLFAGRLTPPAIDLVSVAQALVVAEYLSFSAAAVALGVRQSGVSKRVRRLEEQLGVALFERRPRGVRPMVAGETFFAATRAVLLQLDNAVAGAQQGGRGEQGSPGLHKRSAEGWGYRPGRFHLPCRREGEALSNSRGACRSDGNDAGPGRRQLEIRAARPGGIERVRCRRPLARRWPVAQGSADPSLSVIAVRRMSPYIADQE
jgi:hypothetical protein